jgi:hypothetical protein
VYLLIPRAITNPSSDAPFMRAFFPACVGKHEPAGVVLNGAVFFSEVKNLLFFSRQSHNPERHPCALSRMGGKARTSLG